MRPFLDGPRLSQRDRPAAGARIVVLNSNEAIEEQAAWMDEVLADSVFLDVTGRTAKRILDLSHDSDEFDLPLTQEQLAGLVGASRERVNKAIATFVKLGWLEQNERSYRILRRDQLELRAL